MVAQPKQMHDMHDIGEMGQRARATVPLAREQRALSEQTQVLTRDLCWRCGGTGCVDRPFVECERCGGVWTQEQLATHLRTSWQRTLPCGHRAPAGRGITYVNATCPTCGGGRYLEIWRALGEMLDFIETLYRDSRDSQDSGAVTAPVAAQRTAP